LKGRIDDAELVIARPDKVDEDPEGRPRYWGYIRDIPVKVVVALDEPNLIVTIHERRK
jgi:hypothetical protein